MPWLPFVALGLVIGACSPQPLALWWLWGSMALAIIALLHARFPVAARWTALAAAAAIGTAVSVPLPSPSDATRLISVHGTVSSVRWQAMTQGFIVYDATAILPSDWESPSRLFIRSPGVPGVRPGDAITASGVWSTGVRGESLRAITLEVQPREDGPHGFAWRTIARIGDHQELAAALLLGRGDPPERDAFRTAGLAHVLAVSGMHLAIAAGLAWWLLRALGVGWGGRLVALGVLVIGYTWLTSASPATVRACVMSLAVIAYSSLGREAHRLGPVALAALVLVLWDPGMARNAGFQLSLAAVLGITTIGIDLIAWRKLVLPLRAWPLDRAGWRLLLWLVRAGCDGLVIGIAATLATTPLVAWHFGVVAPWSCLTSVIAGIPATIALWAGLPLLLCAGVWPNGPWEGLYRVVEWNIDALASCASWGAAHLPQLPSAPPSALALCAWPLLFIRLHDGWDLLLRSLAMAALVWIW